MAGHYVEVEGYITTIYEGVYQTLHKLQAQKLIDFVQLAPKGVFTCTYLNWKSENRLKGRGTNARVDNIVYITYVPWARVQGFVVGKRDGLRTLVDSYARHSHQHSRKIVVPSVEHLFNYYKVQ